jgi:hypothetical protein
MCHLSSDSESEHRTRLPVNLKCQWPLTGLPVTLEADSSGLSRAEVKLSFRPDSKLHWQREAARVTQRQTATVTATQARLHHPESTGPVAVRWQSRSRL